ncbi:MAG TPA: periplasmic heavy metal sensor [Hyphomonadaceae bacterium]|nr:periplasmic heavy metal sensor [Hyphomonadaceae bacterium]HPI47629.1 periplasmic heavy metal sensor [Hyphomonadaceae bacterium]
MKVSVRSAIVTVVLAFLAGIGGMWLGRQLLTAPAHDQSLHAMVHNELSLTAEQDKALHALEADFAARRQTLEAEMREANAELAAAIRASETAGPAVEAAVHHFHDAMGALQTETIAHVFAMRKVLAPEQRRQFDDRIGEALTADAK